MTNHQNNSMEMQIFKGGRVIEAWQLYNRRHIPLESLSAPLHFMEHSLKSAELLVAAITGPLLESLYNVITNTWDPNLRMEELPSHGKVFKKMHFHGHSVGWGNHVTVPHGEESSQLWFAKIVHFLHFDRVSALCLLLEYLRSFYKSFLFSG